MHSCNRMLMGLPVVCQNAEAKQKHFLYSNYIELEYIVYVIKFHCFIIFSEAYRTCKQVILHRLQNYTTTYYTTFSKMHVYRSDQ